MTLINTIRDYLQENGHSPMQSLTSDNVPYLAAHHETLGRVVVYVDIYSDHIGVSSLGRLLEEIPHSDPDLLPKILKVINDSPMAGV